MDFRGIGFTERDFFRTFILKTLTEGDSHGGEMYRRLLSAYPNRVFSRTQFYKALREMETGGLIECISSPERKKRVFRITERGRTEKTSYREQFLEIFTVCRNIAKAFLYEITRTGKRPDNLVFTRENQRFFSRLVSVRNLSVYFVLRELSLNPHGVGRQLLQTMLIRIGWNASEGYFYEILRDLEESGAIKGTWESDRRTRRFYRITDFGERLLKKIEVNVVFSIREIDSLTQILIQFLEEGGK